MKGIYRSILMGFTSIFLLSLGASAEIKPNSIELGAFGGYSYFDHSQNLEPGAILGGRVGYNFTRHFGVEGVYEKIMTAVDDKTITGQVEGQFRSPMDDVRLTLYYVDAVYHFSPEQNLVPFVVAGVGGASYRPTISTADDMLSFNLGGGVKYRLSDRVSVRLDMRDVIVTEGFQETYNNFGVTAGVFFTFGGGKKPAPTPSFTPVAAYNAPRSSLIGPAGPAGAKGATGIQGERGWTGASGVALAGQRGLDGPSGPSGIRGQVGATGAAGAVAVGPTGVAGPIGSAGMQGERGWTGTQGASAMGFAGPVGEAGSTGIQGERGKTGVQGPTLVGPSGPAGEQGAVGVRGARGEMGEQGVLTAGVSGPAGWVGVAGEQGRTGPTGAEGPTGAMERWTSYRDFWFGKEEENLQPSDAGLVNEIALYMKRNPSLVLGIDNFMDFTVQSPHTRRVNAVRDAMIKSGVPAERIMIGGFGEPKLRSNARVEILIKSSRY